MHKQIVLSLFLISMQTYAMELILSNNDLLSHITPHIISQHKEIRHKAIHHNLQHISQDITTLLFTTKHLNTYYSNENIQKVIITLISNAEKASDQDIAYDLRFKHIFNKLKNLEKIAENRNLCFSPEDLTDTWYVNASIGFCKRSLLIPAINKNSLSKVTALINAGINLNPVKHYRYPLLLIMDLRNCNIWGLANFTTSAYLDIAQLLLAHGADPDLSESINHSTALMFAAKHGDELYAQLLLEYDADPYLQKEDIGSGKMKTAFDIEHSPKGWLQKLIDKVAQEKKEKAQLTLT